jgi:PAS domain S-box-containing protein
MSDKGKRKIQRLKKLEALHQRIAELENIEARHNLLQQALRESEEWYRQISEHCREVFWMADAKLTRTIYVSPSYEKVWGRTCVSLYAEPRSWIEGVHPADRQRVGKAMLTKATEGYNLEYRILRGDGTVGWVRDRSFPIRNRSGEVCRIAGIAEDITEHKENRKTTSDGGAKHLKLSEEFNDLLNAIPDALSILSPQLEIIWANRAAALAVGEEASALVGKHCYELRHNRTQPCESCPSRASFNTGEPANASAVTPDRRHWELRSTPIKDEKGKVVQVIEWARDVTDNCRSQEQLRQTQKMEAIGTLAGGIAHDFNNILSAIVGYSDLALPLTSPGDETRYYLEQTLKSGNRARDLVKQILAFSRQHEQEKKLLKIGSLLKETIKLIRASLPSTIEIETKLSAQSDWVRADATQIHQMLMNLYTNAWHAMRGGKGMLRISLEEVHLDSLFVAAHQGLEPGPHVKLEVSDTGDGMTSAVIERIFEPYFTTKARGDGTGLGLAVVDGIVKSHKGAITVASAPDKGSTFTIFLPRIELASEELENEDFPLPRGSECILYVDDEPTLVEIGRIALERLGYRIIFRTSSTEALETFHTHPERYDLVITDLTMPKLTGIDLAKEIMSISPHTPIIMCTGFSEEISKEEVAAAGIQETILKPTLVRDLAEAVRRVLGHNNGAGKPRGHYGEHFDH